MMKIDKITQAALLTVAETVAVSARQFATNYSVSEDASVLAGVDALLPSADKFKGDVCQK